MRTSDNHYHNGQLQNGYDYDLQVWVENGIIQDCGHPRKEGTGYYCCNARRYKGEKVTVVKSALATLREIRAN